VGASAETYTASYTGLTGISVALPGAFTVAKGATHTFNVTFTNVGAFLNSYVGGQFTLTGDKGHVVRIPVVIRPVLFSAPTQVSGSYTVLFGYTGAFSATARGLVPAAVTPGTVNQDPDQTFSLADPTGTVAIPVILPVGTTYARFSLFDADVTAGSDLDLYVYEGSTLRGSSAGGTSAEEVNITYMNPTAAPIALTVYVHGWGVAGGTSSPFSLHAWAVPGTASGNMTVTAPASAVVGPGTITLSFSGLTPGLKYLGSVAYSGIFGLPNPTIVVVNP
jgi:hypothetical protein